MKKIVHFSHDHAHDCCAHKHDDHGEHEHHVMPLMTYYVIFGALLFLTILTVGVSYMNLGGSLAIGAALFVACIKAFLVAAFFMHLKYEEKFNQFLAISTLFFVVLFFALTFADLDTRGLFLKVQDNWTLIHDQAAEAGPAPAEAPVAAPASH